MTTWIFILLSVILCAHIVEGDFGERDETNGTLTTLSPSTDSGESSNMMMIIVADDGVEVQKAALTAMISQGDDVELSSSTPSTTTENTKSTFDMSLENDKTEEGKFQDPVDETISSTPTSGWDQIGFNRFGQLQDEPTASKYFESNKIETSKNTQENDQLELQQDYSENNDINNDYISLENHMPMRPIPTQYSHLYDGSLDKKNPLHERIQQNRLYQIEAAKAYIKQIQFEQEYALRSQGLQDKYIGNSHYDKPSLLPQVQSQMLSYIPPSTSSSHYNNQSPGLISVGIHSTSSGLRTHLTHNDYNYVSGTRHWNESPNQLNEPYRQFGSVESKKWDYLHNTLEHNQYKKESPSSKTNTNRWNAFSPNLHPAHVLPYTGPTASPVVLPSGYLDETEEVKEAREIHLRAISGAIPPPPTHWRNEPLIKSWR